MSHHLVGVTEVATLLGVSRQRVHQLSESAADFPEPEAELSAGKVWSRAAIETWMANHPERVGHAAARGALSEFSEDALHLLVRAEDEARQLNHDFLGTEHLLIALVSMDSGRVPASLATLSLGRAQVLDEVLTAVPRGDAPVTGRPAFTPRTFRTLQAATELSKREGREKAEPRDLLLALLADADGVATQALLRRSHARSLDVLRRQIRAALDLEDDPLAVADRASRPVGGDSLVRCSFCSKTQKELKKLIAGPGVYICDECIALCQQIIDEDAAAAAEAQPIAEQLRSLGRDLAAIASRLELAD